VGQENAWTGYFSFRWLMSAGAFRAIMDAGGRI
jgi:hypothetical protein